MKDLSLEHYRTLSEGSGISDEVIELRPYKTVTEPAELIKLGFSRAQSRNVPGLLLPVNCTDGTNGLTLYRPDTPRVIQDKNHRNRDGTFKERIIKYEMPPKVGVRLDCPRICRTALVDPDRPLWITEGQKKADALASRGAVAIALLGVWNFNGRNSMGGVSLLADFDYVTWKNRDVRVVFDSDVMTKAGVRKALERLREHLQRKGAHVAAVYLPTENGAKVGVDDYLLTHNLDDLEALIEGPRLAPRAAAPTVELVEDEPVTMKRPISLINGRAYAAIWPLVRVTTRERQASNGDIIKLDKPIEELQRRALVVRDDGRIFTTTEDDDVTNFEPLPEDFLFQLDTIPEAKHCWSTAAVRRYHKDGARPEPAAVFRRICEIIDHYIDFDRSLADQQTMSEMIACYVLATWFLDAFQVIGYLYPNGEFGSGKSELLNAVTQMAFLGEMVMAQSTIATIRDAADYGGTLAFDEVERLQQDKTKQDLVAILLAGNRKGSTLAAKEPSADGDGKKWVTRRYNCFCARLFAAIRLPDGALASRSIIVPLIRSVDTQKPNRMVTAVEDWPHNRRELIDDLWALALTHLSKLKAYDEQVGSRARLKGRQLEPWRAILAVAGWLDDNGTAGLWDRLHTLAQGYQAESAEMDSTSLTKLVIRALDALLDEPENAPVSASVARSLFAGINTGVAGVAGVSGVSGVISEGDTPPIKTSEISSAVLEISRSEELPIKEEAINPRSIGWIMKKLRFQHANIGHNKLRGWRVTRSLVERHKLAFGLFSGQDTPATPKTTPETPETPAAEMPAPGDEVYEL